MVDGVMVDGVMVDGVMVDGVMDDGIMIHYAKHNTTSADLRQSSCYRQCLYVVARLVRHEEKVVKSAAVDSAAAGSWTCRAGLDAQWISYYPFLPQANFAAPIIGVGFPGSVHLGN